MPIRPTDNPDILNMRGLNLFHYSYSNCSMRIRLFLDEKGIPWNDHFVDLRAQKNLTEEYFAIHPQGLVPALVDDGVIVHESADILEYLEDKFNELNIINYQVMRKNLPPIRSEFGVCVRNSKPHQLHPTLAVQLPSSQESSDIINRADIPLGHLGSIPPRRRQLLLALAVPPGPMVRLGPIPLVSWRRSVP